MPKASTAQRPHNGCTTTAPRPHHDRTLTTLLCQTLMGTRGSGRTKSSASGIDHFLINARGGWQRQRQWQRQLLEACQPLLVKEAPPAALASTPRSLVPQCPMLSAECSMLAECSLHAQGPCSVVWCTPLLSTSWKTDSQSVERKCRPFALGRDILQWEAPPKHCTLYGARSTGLGVG